MLESGGWKATEPPRNAQGMLTAVHERTGLTFVLVPGGSFTMGSPAGEERRGLGEGPEHSVNVRALLMCATECTQAAWEKGGGANGSQWKGPQLPVEKVDWNEGREWCGRNGLRLPSEAEWEYACRAGTSTRFSFGDADGSLAEHAWFADNSGGATHPVGQRRANPWGLFDVYGNVSEWCEDLSHRNYSGAPADGTAWTAGGWP